MVPEMAPEMVPEMVGSNDNSLMVKFYQNDRPCTRDDTMLRLTRQTNSWQANDRSMSIVTAEICHSFILTFLC